MIKPKKIAEDIPELAKAYKMGEDAWWRAIKRIPALDRLFSSLVIDFSKNHTLKECRPLWDAWYAGWDAENIQL